MRTSHQEYSVTSLDGTKPLYILPEDNIVEDVLIPAFSSAGNADCMVGFFSSASLTDIAPGLATYIKVAPSPFRLIASPFLSAEDQVALEEGLRTPMELAQETMAELLITSDEIQCHTLRCLSYLLSVGRLEFKVAIQRDGLFHPKVWLFSVQQGVMAVHGSSNMTHSGVKRNKEQVSVSKDWQDQTQGYTVQRLSQEFERLWGGRDPDCVMVPLPEAIQQKLLSEHHPERIPTEGEFRELYKRALRSGNVTLTDESETPVLAPAVFTIPSWLEYRSGPFAHQGKAVQAWLDAGYRGTLEMATGSGKTLTSMICAHELHQQSSPLLIVVAAPYIPLIEQWCGEIELFGLKPQNLSAVVGASRRAKIIQRLRRRLKHGLSNVEVILVSHETLCTDGFQSALQAVDCPRLLIGDEVHNLGRPGFLRRVPEFFDHRLALSATPKRQYDPDGTEAVFDFFGPVVFSFTLEEAIGTCLVEYDYYLHPVRLTQHEMDEWYRLTNLIRQNAWRSTDDDPDSYLDKLFRDRRVLLETASSKLIELSRLLDLEDLASLKHTLVYTTDKAPEQLKAVNKLLGQKGLMFHQITALETRDRLRTASIIREFQSEGIRILTAKRVLDEGVNIPQVSKAYILASTTVERQWIQRRGRLLRLCPAIGKTHSIVHDFITLPPAFDDGNWDEDSRTLVRSELRRVQEFARLARNAGKPDGPLSLVSQLVKTVFG